MINFLITIWTLPNDLLGWLFYFVRVKIWYALRGFKMKAEKRSHVVNYPSSKLHGLELKYYFVKPANQKSKDNWALFRSSTSGQTVFMFAEDAVQPHDDNEKYYFIYEEFLMHEYGHVAQARAWGPLFLVFALLNITVYTYDYYIRYLPARLQGRKYWERDYQRDYHTKLLIESDANKRAGITWKDLAYRKLEIVIEV